MKKITLTTFLLASCISYVAAQCTETNSGGTSRATSSSSIGQSFSPSCTGQLETIAVNGHENSADHTVIIYEGLGTGGTALGIIGSQSIVSTGSVTDLSATVFDFSSENVSLVSGSDYTFVISDEANLRASTSNPYGDGQFYLNGSFISGSDLNFEVEIGAPLPVVWSAQPIVEQSGSVATISFAVAQQINNSHFEIEHSLDGETYVAIGEILGEGNTSEVMDYTFDHPTPSQGHNYYRVKQVDFDGNYSYSNVTSFTIQHEQVVVYPNPVTNVLRINSPKSDHVAIYSLLGQELRSQVLQEGVNSVDMTELQGGMYMMKFDSGEVRRILKQ
ncbi:MAG: T9SS type A sorting domain-containing protein [Bacteroidota bacterium]